MHMISECAPGDGVSLKKHHLELNRRIACQTKWRVESRQVSVWHVCRSLPNTPHATIFLSCILNACRNVQGEATADITLLQSINFFLAIFHILYSSGAAWDTRLREHGFESCVAMLSPGDVHSAYVAPVD